jgi:hypothetical protein
VSEAVSDRNWFAEMTAHPLPVVASVAKSALETIDPLLARIAELEAENKKLRDLAAAAHGVMSGSDRHIPVLLDLLNELEIDYMAHDYPEEPSRE